MEENFSRTVILCRGGCAPGSWRVQGRLVRTVPPMLTPTDQSSSKTNHRKRLLELSKRRRGKKKDACKKKENIDP